MNPKSGHWLGGPIFDLALFSGPALLSSILTFAVPTGQTVGPLAWLVLVVGVDVAHVWSTIWRAVGDPVGPSRWGLRWILLPLATLLALIVVWQAFPQYYWRALAYLAVWHFIRQQVGIAALYQLRFGLPPNSVEARLERALHWFAAGLPVLWWHTQPPRSFAWFMPGDFIGGWSIYWFYAGSLLGAGALLGYMAVRLRQPKAAWGRDLWLMGAIASWWSGIVLNNSDFAFTLTNVLSHGIPYMALVGLLEARRAQHESRIPKWIFRGPGLALLLGVPLVLALGEEFFWDRLIWLEHPHLFSALDLWGPLLHPLERAAAHLENWENWIQFPAQGGAPEPGPRMLGLGVALLSLPQVAHYLLDGVIWRGKDNPSLSRLLLDQPTPTNTTTAG